MLWFSEQKQICLDVVNPAEVKVLKSETGVNVPSGAAPTSVGLVSLP